MVTSEIELFKKSMNVLAFVHLSNPGRNPRKAIECFKRLRDAAQEDKDYESKMYAYQQLGKCYQQLKDYQKAILCFKKQLQLAWLVESIEGEMNAYDNLALQYYYEGDIDKSKYYNDRMIRGKVEARFSIVRKMS